MITIIYIILLIKGKLDWAFIAKLACLIGFIFADILLIGIAATIGFYISVLFGI